MATFWNSNYFYDIKDKTTEPMNSNDVVISKPEIVSSLLKSKQQKIDLIT